MMIFSEEPPFPVYYNTTEKSSSLVVDTFRTGQITPLSGQVCNILIVF